jgi:hypothetical protein
MTKAAILLIIASLMLTTILASADEVEIIDEDEASSINNKVNHISDR